ncbi:acyl-CoA synthetase [Arhodomonas aquaeolei]|uniref:acyl-CoA synthetase n=1 Tax=Arhodomonas aquaeolei TaxID=2369 RepID=UPI000364D897|nr:acyl-CoA synthetase [Arhodomonas aquaeolei]
MLASASSYEAQCRAFRWRIPAEYNIGVDVLDRHADAAPGNTAIIHDLGDGGAEHWSFERLRADSNRLANALAGLGLERGDRVGLLLSQRPETVVAHTAVYRLGGIAVPLFTLFGPDALAYRLGDCGARVLVTDAACAETVAALRERLPALETVIVVGGDAPAGMHAWRTLLDGASAAFTPVTTRAEDPAVIIYTSGTTGQPKGALHAHRVLLGHLPGVEQPHEGFPQPGDCFWTPADWAWIGGLLDVLLPSLHHGVPVVAHRARRFDPEAAFALIARHGVRNAFLPPTALKLMRQVPDAAERFGRHLRSVGSGGESLGSELLDWGRETLGVTINEFYGQTECNLIVANRAGLMPLRPGSMGRAVPGHRVAVIDEAGNELPAGKVGAIAVHAPDPVMFLGYWNRPEATAEKFRGEWLVTGDTGCVDEDGYFRFVGRDDDVITSAGYRIGPGEVEDCLMHHPSVAMVAVVGSPDPLRTQVVKAFVVPAEGVTGDEALAESIRQFVRERLAAHEYPREVEFVAELPMTTTGKIIRRELREREQRRKGGG